MADFQKNQKKCPIPERLNQFIVFGVALGGFITSCLFLKSCSFMSSDIDGMGRIGLFSYETNNGQKKFCKKWSESLEFDKSERAARAVGVIAAVFGGIAVTVLFAQTFWTMGRNVWKSMGALLVISCAVQALVFIQFNSRLWCRPKLQDGYTFEGGNQCEIELGSMLAISASVLYFGSGVAILLMRPPSEPFFDFSYFAKKNTEETKVSPMQMMDESGPSLNPMQVPIGQKTVKKETLHADGTKTVSYETVPV